MENERFFRALLAEVLLAANPETQEDYEFCLKLKELITNKYNIRQLTSAFMREFASYETYEEVLRSLRRL